MNLWQADYQGLERATDKTGQILGARAEYTHGMGRRQSAELTVLRTGAMLSDHQPYDCSGHQAKHQPAFKMLDPAQHGLGSLPENPANGSEYRGPKQGAGAIEQREASANTQ